MKKFHWPTDLLHKAHASEVEVLCVVALQDLLRVDGLGTDVRVIVQLA